MDDTELQLERDSLYKAKIEHYTRLIIAGSSGNTAWQEVTKIYGDPLNDSNDAILERSKSKA